MARKTNWSVKGKEYFKINRKVGKKLNDKGIWVDDYKCFYGSCKSEAEEKYEKYMQRQQEGVSSDECIGVLIDKWIESTFQHSALANSTKVKYIAAYNKIFRPSHAAGLPIAEITALDIQRIYNEAEDCYSTIRALNNLLTHFFKYAELNGLAKNILHSVVVPRKPKQKAEFADIDVWDDNDLKKVIAALEGSTLRLLVVLAANTGARFAELLALTYSDIKNNSLYISKQLSEIAPVGNKEVKLHVTSTKTTNSNRIIPLSKAVLAEIEKHKDIHRAEMSHNGYITDHIFTTSKGTLYYKRNVARSLKRLYARIGVPYHSFHAFRHTFGTNLSRAGVPIEETSKLMGHSDISITAKYYVYVNAQRRLSSVEKIVGYSL